MGSLVDTLTFDVFDLDASKQADAARSAQNILEKSAGKNIALQEEQLERVRQITEPFRVAATGTALPTLSSLAFGGDVDFQPSQLLQQQLTQGREDILRGQAAKGGIKSGRTFERLSDLATGLAAEDVGRFERGQLSILQPGQETTRQLGQAGTALTGNIAGVLSNLQQGVGQTAQSLAQSQLAAGQTAQSGFQGLGDLALDVFKTGTFDPFNLISF